MKYVVVLLIALLPGLLMAHPHFSKTVTAALPGGVEATVTYTTVPANEEHTNNAAEGSFITPRSPRLTLSGDVQTESVTIPAGEHIVGVIKNGAEEWVLVLYPGRLGRGEQPDPSKLIKLESVFVRLRDANEHLLIDITPGDGALEGKAVLLINFGTLSLIGALS